MFVYTLKASGLKFFAAIVFSVAVLIALIGIIPTLTAASDVASVTTDFRHIEDESDIISFLNSCELEVEPTPTKTFEFTIPESFNSVFEKYNEIQRSQGLNLKRYCGKTATVYVFKVKETDFEGEVFATVFVRNGQIIAGDISSSDNGGFVKTLSKI